MGKARKTVAWKARPALNQQVIHRSLWGLGAPPSEPSFTATDWMRFTTKKTPGAGSPDSLWVRAT
jgi:hypothetical protein